MAGCQTAFWVWPCKWISTLGIYGQIQCHYPCVVEQGQLIRNNLINIAPFSFFVVSWQNWMEEGDQAAELWHQTQQEDRLFAVTWPFYAQDWGEKVAFSVLSQIRQAKQKPFLFLWLSSCNPVTRGGHNCCSQPSWDWMASNWTDNFYLRPADPSLNLATLSRLHFSPFFLGLPGFALSLSNRMGQVKSVRGVSKM